MGRIDPAQQPAIESVPLSSTLVPAERRARHLRKPWSSIQSLGFVGQVDLLVPRSCADAVQRKLAEREAATAQPQYARVVMTLGQVLEGAFFKEYIKAGHILMLSKGRPGQDNVFSLKDGRLTLFLERETYERAGLDGKPHGVKDSRGLRPRWVVEIDLNAKAMWPGKAGYERVVYACKNVLNKPVTWLLCNKFDTPSPDPLAAFSPDIITVAPTITEQTGLQLPPLGRPENFLAVAGDSFSADNAEYHRLNMQEDIRDLYEWLSLVRLGSPRVSSADSIDPYLSRYQVPLGSTGLHSGTDSASHPPPADVSLFRWRGFVSPTWACQTLLDTLVAMPGADAWLAFSVSSAMASKGLADSSAEVTFFRPLDEPREFMLWQVSSHE